MCRGVGEKSNEFIDVSDTLNWSQGTPYLTKSTISYVSAVMEGCCVYPVIEVLKPACLSVSKSSSENIGPNGLSLSLAMGKAPGATG